MINSKHPLDFCMMATEDNFIIGLFIINSYYKFLFVTILFISQGVRHFIQKNFDDFYLCFLVYIWY